MAKKNSQKTNNIIIKTYINYSENVISMKKLIILLILAVLISNSISAKTIEEILYEGDSIEVQGYNITLMGIGNEKKSIAACINNKIYLMDKKIKKEIENLKIEPTRIYEDYIKLQITYTKENTCNESCSNIFCFGEESIKQQENKSTTQNQSITQQQTTQEKNSINTFSIILFLIVLILLIILLTKKKKR